MTIPAGQTSITTHLGNGVASVFAYDFKITDETDLLVTTVDLLGVEVALTLAVDYTVTGVGASSGGTITLLAGALTSGWTIALVDNVPADQLTPFSTQGAFFAILHENAFDKVTRLYKRAFDLVGNSFKLPDYITGVSTTLPAPSSLKGMRWNTGATALEEAAIISSLTASGAITTTDNGDGTWTLSVTGTGGDVLAAGNTVFTGDNTFEGDNTHTGTELFSGSLPASNTFGEVALGLNKLAIMKGDGTSDTAAELVSFGSSQMILRQNSGGAAITWDSSSDDIIGISADLFSTGKVTRPNGVFANLAAITAYYAALTATPSYAEQVYVTGQGQAIYLPSGVTGLASDGWVLVEQSSSQTYSARISAAGSVTSGALPSGWVLTRPSTGNYLLTHNEGTAGLTRVTTTSNEFADRFIASDDQVNYFSIFTRDSAGTDTNSDFTVNVHVPYGKAIT